MAKLTEQSRVQCAMYEHQFCQYCVKFLVLVGPQMHDKNDNGSKDGNSDISL